MIGQSDAFNEAALTGRRDFLDLGSGKATILVYGNTRPAKGAAAGAAALFTLTLAKPCGAVSAGVLTLAADAASFIVMNSGAPAWARILNGNGDFAMDCGASGPSGSAEVMVSSDTVIAGGSVALISAVFG